MGEESVSSAIRKLVPAVGSTDEDTLGHLTHNMADVSVELRSSQVPAVEGLGTDSDGVDDVLITGNGFLDGGPIAREGRLRKQVVGVSGLTNPIQTMSTLPRVRERESYTYHMPRTTLKPLLLAAGRMF